MDLGKELLGTQPGKSFGFPFVFVSILLTLHLSMKLSEAFPLINTLLSVHCMNTFLLTVEPRIGSIAQWVGSLPGFDLWHPISSPSTARSDS